MSRQYSPLTIKLLFSRAGYCAHPDCGEPLQVDGTDGPLVNAEIAHIEALADDGPRANTGLSEKERNEYGNLVLLCPTHHAIVDKDPEGFPAETLRKWKTNVEKLTQQRLAEHIVAVGFGELQVVCDAFADGSMREPSSTLIAVPPADKIAANALTESVRPLINLGFSQTRQVAEYIGQQAELSHTFPERLRGGFVEEYRRLKEQGSSGDELFMDLVDFGVRATRKPGHDANRQFALRAAVLSVLCHLFEVCDVFEAPA